MSQPVDHPIILPPAYFPPVSWMALLIANQIPVVDVHSWYEKQQLSSRTWIQGPDGPVCLTIPVERRSSKAPLCEKKVSYQENWPESHFRSLRNSYRNSPYFEVCEEEVKSFFDQRPDYLVEWIDGSLQLVNQLLGESYRWVQTQNFLALQEGKGDYRKEFTASWKRELPWYSPIIYQQVFEPFTSGLSILDLLFSKGRETILIAKSGITDIK